MVQLDWLKDGLVFTSGEFFLFKGAYSCIPQRPEICDKCNRQSSSFHAHGRFRRSLLSLKVQVPTLVKVWRHRWLCLCCGRTMSNGSADVIGHIPNCTLVVIAVLWVYLNGLKGIHNSVDPQLEAAACPRTLARYLKRAKAVSSHTQQTIREILIQTKEPRPWDVCFAHGLSPPEALVSRHHDPATTASLWRAIAMLRIGSMDLNTAPCLLMARARTASQHRQIRILL